MSIRIGMGIGIEIVVPRPIREKLGFVSVRQHRGVRRRIQIHVRIRVHINPAGVHVNISVRVSETPAQQERNREIAHGDAQRRHVYHVGSFIEKELDKGHARISPRYGIGSKKTRPAKHIARRDSSLGSMLPYREFHDSQVSVYWQLLTCRLTRPL
jgi:hypothetical protein